MNWFGKKVSKVNRLESESVITPQTNGRRSHLMASLLKQIFHLHLEFFCHKMLHILPKKVRNEQREKTLFMSENDQSGHQCRTLAQNPRDSSQLWPAAKDYYGIFGRAMLEVKKKLVLTDCYFLFIPLLEIAASIWWKKFLPLRSHRYSNWKLCKWNWKSDLSLF